MLLKERNCAECGEMFAAKWNEMTRAAQVACILADTIVCPNCGLRFTRFENRDSLFSKDPADSWGTDYSWTTSDHESRERKMIERYGPGEVRTLPGSPAIARWGFYPLRKKL